MIKKDEKKLYKELRQRFPEGTLRNVERIFEVLGIQVNRGYYILEKWADKGYIDYGVSVRGAWFIPGAPEELK